MKITLAGLMAITMMSGVADAQMATPTDKAFVAKVSQGGMFEVAAGRLTMAKGSTQDIRDFGNSEVHDHMLVGDTLKSISKTKAAPISATLNAEFAAKMTHLSSLSGAAFDAAYLSEMSTLHDIDGAAFDAEATGGGSPAYRDFGRETHRIVLRHIGAIRAIPAA